MLTQRFTKTKLVAIILIALFSNNIFAKPISSPGEDTKSDRMSLAIKNIAVGIESENAGVKKCCIFYAGYYEFNELVDVLVKQLKKEQDTDTKILIVLSLYKIGDKKGMEAIKQLVGDDTNQFLREMALIK